MQELKKRLSLEARLEKAKRIIENVAVFRSLFGQDSRINQDLPINPAVSIHTHMTMDNDGDYEFKFNLKDQGSTIVVYVRIDTKGEIAWTTADGAVVPSWHDIAQWTVDSVLFGYESSSNKVREKAETFLAKMEGQGYAYRRVGEAGVFYLKDNAEMKKKVDSMKTKEDAIKHCDMRIKI